MQCDVRGIYIKLDQFKSLLEDMETKPDVIAVQETHLIPKFVA